LPVARRTGIPAPPRHTVNTPIMSGSSDPEREHALEEYKGKLLESREWEAKLKALRLDIKGLQHDFDVSEDNIKALQSVGQIIGEVLKQLDEERCRSTLLFQAVRQR
jgi:ATP-dependent 26S proteasome regulatory subunit